MNHTTSQQQSTTSGKKEIRKQIADKIAAALPELKTALGEKKFESRVKKAVKHITEGMHKKERVVVAKKAKAVKKTATKKAAVKKAAKAMKNAE